MTPPLPSSSRWRWTATTRARRAGAAIVAVLALAAALQLAVAAVGPPILLAAVNTQASAAATSPSSSGTSGSLEAAARKAGDTGRKVAMSLIGLGFAIAAIVLSFKRDFKEAAGIFAVGLVAVLLASPAGLNLLRGTVSSLFGGQ